MSLDVLINPPKFTGWGMSTYTLPPWQSEPDEIAVDFMLANKEIISAAVRGSLVLSQFSNHDDVRQVLSGLMWRHYLIFWTARYAANSEPLAKKTLVECGVCDGLGVLFAMKAMKSPFNAKLYDAWAAMPTGISATEEEMAGQYSFLDVETTKSNLKDYAQNCEFIKGFIPDSFKTNALPNDICWMHIDMNAGNPTKEALNTLFPRMTPRAVVVLDDYAWPSHTETKLVVDDFFKDKRGMLLQFPTGQAVFFSG
jgi:hypothetical protein